MAGRNRESCGRGHEREQGKGFHTHRFFVLVQDGFAEESPPEGRRRRISVAKPARRYQGEIPVVFPPGSLTAHSMSPRPPALAPAMVQAPSMHVPLRHALSLAQAFPPGCPQDPSSEQMLFAHCDAALQAVETGAPQVFVAPLHTPEAHVAFAFASVHFPSWSPSFGIASPARALAVQAKLARAQYWSAPHSLSSQHLPAGTHTPPVLHAPD